MHPVRLAALATLLAFAGAGSARAAYVVTFAQVGPDVVASGGGSLDLNSLDRFSVSISGQPEIQPDTAFERTGANGIFDSYVGLIGGPGDFGVGGHVFATSGTGNLVGIYAANGVIEVPAGYVSGTSLSDTADYAGQTLASLGLTPGSYVYRFGSGVDVDTFTVNIAAIPSVPEPASLALLGGSLLGVGLARYLRRRAGDDPLG